MDDDVTVHITPNTDGSFFVTGTTTARRGGGLYKHDYPDAKALRGFLSAISASTSERLMRPWRR
jgi:hypothetical protein